MDEPGKVLRSFPRIFDDIKVSAGGLALDAIGPLVLKGYQLGKTFSASISEGGALRPVLEAIGDFAAKAAEPIGTLLEGVTGFIKGLDSDAVSGFASSLSEMLPMISGLGSGLAVFAGSDLLKNVPVLGQMLGGLNPVIAGLVTGIGSLLLTDSDLQGMFGELLDSLKPLLPILLEAGKTLLGALMPAFQGVLEAVMPLVPVLADTLVQALAALLPVFIQLIDAVAPLLPIVVELASELIAKLLPPIARLASALIDALAPVLVLVLEALAPLIPPIVELAGALAQILIPIIEALVPLLVPLVQIIGVLLVEAIHLAVNIVYEIVAGLTWFAEETGKVASGVGDFLRMIGGWFQWLFDFLVGNSLIPDLINGITGGFRNLWNWLTEIAGGIRDMLVGAWTWIKDRVSDLVQGLLTVITTPITWLATWIFDNHERVKSIISGAWTWVKDTVTGIAGGLRDAVVGAIQGLIDGITTRFDTMKGLIRDALQWVIDRANDFLNLIFDKDKGLGKFGISIDWRIPDLPKFARGGIADRPSLFGEAGRESAIPWDPRLRQRAEEIWTLTGKALGFFGAMGGPGGSLGEWFRGNFPMTQGPGGSYSHRNAQAWDYAMPTGTPIYMGLPGMVLPGPGGPYGVSAGINPDRGGSLVLGHLMRLIRTGRVPVGEQIAVSDNTGNSTGAHLHLEVRNSTLSPGPGGGEGGGLDVATMIGGWAKSIVDKFTPEAPAWMGGGMLSHFITDSVGGIAQWIGDKFGSLLSGIGNFFGELFGAGQGKATPAQLHQWMEQIGFHPVGGTAWADKIVGRESGFRLDAIGPRWNGDAGSRGLWQIQPGAHPWFQLPGFDGLYNTQAAQRIYQAQGPNAWSTNYDTGGDWRPNSWGFHGNTPTEVVLTSPEHRQLTATLQLVAQRLADEDEPRRPQQVTINIHSETGDPDEIARRVSRVLAQQTRFRS